MGDQINVGAAPQPQPFRVMKPRPAPPTPPPTAEVTPISQAGDLIQQATSAFERHIEAVGEHADGRTPEGVRQVIAQFADSPAAQKIDEAITIAEQREEAAAQRVLDTLRSLSPELDAAGESRATRAWARAQRQLDAASDDRVADTARRLIEDAGDSELGTLITEVPSYLVSRGQSADWVDDIVAARVPELAAAREQLKRASQARPIVNFNASLIRKRIAETGSPSGYTRPPFVASWMLTNCSWPKRSTSFSI